MKKRTIYKSLTIFFFIQLVVISLISRYPELIETYYSTGIYPHISIVFRTFLGWIPFSVGDIYYFLLAIFLLVSIYRFFKNGYKNLAESLFKLGAYLSIFYLLFNLFWGLNYYRDSLFNTLQLEQQAYTLNDLISLSNDLLKKTKEMHFQLTQNDTLKATTLLTKEVIIKQVPLGYNALSAVFPEFNYHPASIKKSLFSLPLTYMGFSGYFNPISGEAQVDYLVPKLSLPMISCHETAHQLGFASESEANFIGFLAATHHPETYYKYSGYKIALQFSIAAVYGKDSIMGKQLIDRIPKGILKNIRETQEFWRTYQNKAEPFFKLFYDNYLKANKQTDGIQGYSNMVGLLVAYRNKYGLD